jgi:DNA mismatch repair ATPase MutS
MMSLDEEEKITNNTMCLWFQKMKSHLIVGVGNIDIYTGKSMLFEYDQEYSATPEAYDNLERYLTTYQPSELIVIHNMDESVVSNILQFADVRSNCLHLYSIETSSDVIKKRFTNNRFWRNISMVEKPKHSPISINMSLVHKRIVSCWISFTDTILISPRKSSRPSLKMPQIAWFLLTIH